MEHALPRQSLCIAAILFIVVPASEAQKQIQLGQDESTEFSRPNKLYLSDYTVKVITYLERVTSETALQYAVTDKIAPTTMTVKEFHY